MKSMRSRNLVAELGPLRRIVAEGANEHGVPTETLECGHVIHRKQDFFGQTNAVRRRCRHCRRTCDWHPHHGPNDKPHGQRCGALATHRIIWLDGSKRYSFACYAHVALDRAAPPHQIVPLR